MMMRGYGHGPGNDWGHGLIWMGGLWVILAAVAVGVLVWLVARGRPGRLTTWTPGLPHPGAPPPAASAAPTPPDPLEVLDLRLARGEVDVETYQATRAALTRPAEQVP